jgi:hypothetical protein
MRRSSVSSSKGAGHSTRNVRKPMRPYAIIVSAMRSGEPVQNV